MGQNFLPYLLVFDFSPSERFGRLLCMLWFLISVPPNGLVVYCGTIVTGEGKEKKVNIDFEPFKPINTSLYLCDNKFHTEVRQVRCLDIDVKVRKPDFSKKISC